jgi:predicted lipid-binding transport protein (Tim44 family)
MKRSLVLVLIGVIAFAVGCAKQEPAPPADTSAAAPGAAGSSTPAAAPAASKPASPAPAPESVKDLPDYPGAVRVAFSEKKAGKDYTHQAEASWTSADPYAKVVEHYQKAIADKGWTIAGTKSKTTEIEWQLTKGTSTGKVEIKDGAPVTIKIERKDR